MESITTPTRSLPASQDATSRGRNASNGPSLTEVFYPESIFGGFTGVDGVVAFYFRLNALLSPDAVVLDVGCGRGAQSEDPVRIRRELRILRGKCSRVIGIDVDPAAEANACLDEFRLITGDRWPVDDASVDLCVSDYVLEHLERPETLFRESLRVLRPGGVLCIRTTNLLSYFGVLSRLIPNRYHGRVLRRVQRARKEEDVFPTVYRCNTVRALQRQLRAHGFVDSVVYGYEAEPAYLSFSRLAYALGVMHQRLAPGPIRPAIFAFARKPGGTASAGEG